MNLLVQRSSVAIKLHPESLHLQLFYPGLLGERCWTINLSHCSAIMCHIAMNVCARVLLRVHKKDVTSEWSLKHMTCHMTCRRFDAAHVDT